MNEVMVLAEEFDLKIFYQDTDSMHILKQDISRLEEVYRNKYNRELIGFNMGQFHSDFDELENAYSYKSIFLGKKCYCDLLKNDKGERGIHYRMKGVDLKCVELVANEMFPNIENPYDRIYALYEELYQGKTISFDLAKTHVRMLRTKSQQIINRNSMIRKIKFNSKECEHISN